ncbi:MAG: mannose-1-phosphate guanylyltransferase/mannose-6-phosphate isomerase [Candidatus Gastranaerophilaceae bacterium]|jgi:mannose-1-phosphate guanylyltransferase/mannose-6-phosphate isomerase
MNKNSNIYGIILAGGSGSRLWPLSREMHPKQLLRLIGEHTLFQSTFLRLSTLIPDINILTVTNVKHSEEIRIQLDELAQNNGQDKKYITLTEPVGKNTAPAIALASFYVIKKLADNNSDPILLIAPSDHLIKKEEEFNKAVIEAVKLAELGYIVTFGINPDRPDTGYGYIKTTIGSDISKITATGLKVSEFKEKPDMETAQKYLEDGSYYWNGGIFMFKASVMLNELRKFVPDIYDLLEKTELSQKKPTVCLETYEKLTNISIDYAVMEKSSLITLVPLDCGWNDLGSWEAIYDVSPKDKNNNYFSGNVVDIDSKNSMVFGTSKLVATIGLENTIVVETDDAVMICDKTKTQDVKKIFDNLKTANNPAYMVHNTIFKSWGHYKILQQEKDFLTKTVFVNPHSKTDFQKTDNKGEHLYVLSGQAKITKENDVFILKTGESIDMPLGTTYCLENILDEDLKILKIER